MTRLLRVLTITCAAIIAALSVTAVASQAVIQTPFYLVDGPADTAGCHSLQVWKNGVLLKTIPADDGDVDSGVIQCAVNRVEWTRFGPDGTGRLVFDWNRK